MIGNSTLAAARRFIACLAALALAACAQTAPERAWLAGRSLRLGVRAEF